MSGRRGDDDRDAVRIDDRADDDVLVLAREARSVGRARTWLAAMLDGRTDADQRTDAVLVVSELVTNSLRHGLGEVVVRAAVDGDGAVQVAVTDAGDEQPTVLPHDPGRIGGVGLRIVDELADRWGVSAFPGGKTTWAVIGSGRAGFGRARPGQ